MRFRLALPMLALLAGLGTTLAAPAVADPGPVTAEDMSAADACYTWGRTLSQGASGDDVRQLQIRVAGYPGYGGVLAIDGQFGAGTKAAVTRFQQAYGLGADGIAGPATFTKIYELQDNDCTPVNFSYDELNNCNSDWSGGNVSAATAKANALVSMWKLQAMRHAMGDKGIVVNGGFRSVACNNAVGGATGSRHLYGDAVDLGAGSQGFCGLAKQARNHGFSEILGPGYPGHNDHTHVAHRSGQFWSAPTCGI
ncbi:D-Ala-D-Ala carboxypeptidase family metallohydrolase [Amycolatopsis magusensis]|uniref:Zinc D-Ala-D-Ala carboxypeptidase n=1 Tax=Amycolatopsis magusensis TaxID=882444 RepID=A0ABS4PSW5_9PSEU|nr:D-Ala-D-Ala carboxypeptidase family metallohydrolase [Amycolatopsis magusensis]MBP2182511.1 zinc D-Ala-D-Ala carboxypeptidase [Amycolatopsis magusensis]MDI5981187.1 D-Ala-D-Ala carboxypeptidase family metallohydrolase [Amycolatopsis magusensis]